MTAPAVHYRDRRFSPPHIETLRQITVLAPLSERALDRLAAVARCRSYPNGEELPADWSKPEPIVCCVLRGSIELSFRTEESNERVVSCLTAGGCVELSTAGWAAPDETVATVRSSSALICTLPYAAFEEEVIACSEAARRLLAAHRQWLRELGAVASDQMHRPATRIRHALWRDNHDEPDHAVSYTHETLAAHAWADRPTTTRVIGQLRQRGVIETERQGHRIIVLNPDALLDEH